MICHCGHDSKVHTRKVAAANGTFIGGCEECDCFIPHDHPITTRPTTARVMGCDECYKESPEGIEQAEISKALTSNRRERMEFTKEAVRKLANEYNSKFPDDEAGAYKYYLFNAVSWE